MPTWLAAREYSLDTGKTAKQYRRWVSRNLRTTTANLRKTYQCSISGTAIGPPDWRQGNTAYAYIFFSPQADGQIDGIREYLSSREWSVFEPLEHPSQESLYNYSR